MTGVAATTRLKQVGQVLVEQRLVTEAQLQEALTAQKSAARRKLLGEVVVELGFCTELQVLESLAQAYGIPFARLTPRLVDASIATRLPRDFVDQHGALPLFLVDGTMTVAVSEPSDVFLVEELATRMECEVQIVASPRGDLRAAADAAFRSPARDTRAIEDILAETDAEEKQAVALQEEPAAGADDDRPDSPVVKLVQQLIVTAVREGASDIHIEPGDRNLRVRFRVDGRLHEKMRPPYSTAAVIVSRVKIMAGLDIAERRLPQDGGIRVDVDGRKVDLRVSTLPNPHGEKVVLRILDTESALISLDRLGMASGVRDGFERQVRKPHGLVLVTGPTGSGKTTTLYSAMQVVASPEINISTVEDPIEYKLPEINQFQVKERIGLGFPQMLRSLLRQDPDVIMVGEIRDPETARIAVQAALTGHLVLSTLHTNDAAGAVSRLHNLSVESYLLSASLEGVLAQRLARRICPHCRGDVPVPPHVRLALEGTTEVPETMVAGRGCAECHQLGTKGRVGLYELFEVNDEMREAISREESTTALRNMAIAQGMRTLREDGIAKALAGETTFDEVLRATVL
jgi:type IV pilus assembly protein PilB